MAQVEKNILNDLCIIHLRTVPMLQAAQVDLCVACVNAKANFGRDRQANENNQPGRPKGIQSRSGECKLKKKKKGAVLQKKKRRWRGAYVSHTCSTIVNSFFFFLLFPK